MTKKEFLTKEFPRLLGNLNPDTTPNFGLMTPQHMVEHLTMVIKTSVKRYGDPIVPPTKGQLGFKKFIQKGAVMKHFPSDKTKDDLPELRYATLDEALAQIPIAVERFYAHYEAHPVFISYSRMAGELNFEELELLHYMHTRYHLWQFGLLATYP